MIQAPVGHQCPTCVREGNKGVRQVHWPPSNLTLGGRVTPVVAILIGINVAVFLIGNARPAVSFDYGLLPVEIAKGQYYRLLTSAFLHAGLVHIAFNMGALAIVGSPLEEAIGRLRFIGLYLVAALGGSVCSYLFIDPRILGVGASGAIFGVFGAFFVIARSRRADSTTIVVLIVANLLIPFLDPNIDWRAHIGGLITGILLAAGFALAETRSPGQRPFIEVCVTLVMVAVLIGLVQVRTSQLGLLG
jgi:membrane associated rhomboid family serine protease